MASTKSNIAVVGGCIIDLISYVPRFPSTGETLIGKKFHQSFGGKGANQCYMSSILGATTSLIAKVGNDTFGSDFLGHLKANSINIDYVSVEKTSHTSTGAILVTDKGENMIVNVFGAIDFLTAKEASEAVNQIFLEKDKEHKQVLICTLEGQHKTIIAALKTAKDIGVTTLLNAAPLSDKLSPNFYPVTDILCVNETEAMFVTGKKVTSIEEAKSMAQEMFNLKYAQLAVVLTLGENGAVVASVETKEPFHVESPKVKAIDTTGAGDSFVGSLGYFLTYHSHLSLKEMARRACAIASVSVLGEGTQISFPKRQVLPSELFN